MDVNLHNQNGFRCRMYSITNKHFEKVIGRPPKSGELKRFCADVFQCLDELTQKDSLYERVIRTIELRGG